jgi:hypothetical protein
MSTTLMAPPLPDAPYRGIEPFRFTDQQIFAAREEETWALLSNVILYRAVLLYGASGTGKSSLINAGLLPQVLKDGYIPDRLRVQPFAGRELKVERIRKSGREEHAAYLPSNFAASESDASAESIELSLSAFRARLEDFRPAPDKDGSSSPTDAARPRPLLIFDQFEEFITLFEEAQRVGAIEESPNGPKEAASAQHEILKTLVELIQDETLPIKIIFAFREDYLAKLSLLFEYCPELLDQAQRLLPPNIEALPQIIRAPFTNPELRAYFLKQADIARSEITEPLAQKIAAELGRRSEAGNANLTELQIVCQRLWQAPDAEKLFRDEGIEGLLKGYGADVFRHFTPELRDAAVVLLSHMITASNTRNIISEEDLLGRTIDCDFQPAQCTGALTALSQSQIVRREPRHSIYFYEITSEYLVPWIKERVAERKSAEEQRLAEAERQKLEKERAQAVAQFEAEKRRGRLMMRLLAGMGVLGIAVVILGWWGLKQYRQLRATEVATSLQKEQLQELQDVLKAINSPNQGEALQGVQNLDTLIKENKVPSELKSVLIATASTNQDQNVRKAAYSVLTQAAQNDQELTKSIAKAAETNDTLAQQLPPRFYVHYADDSQQGQAQQVAGALKKQGYIVPGIQKAVDKDAKTNQLRYFRKDEPGMPKPDDIVTLLKNTTHTNWRAFFLQGYGSSKIRPGHFEIWFAAVVQATEVKPATGTLVLRLTDPEGNTLTGVRPVITLSGGPLHLSGSTFRQEGTQFDLLEGSYDAVVEVAGYVSNRRRFSIKDNATLELTFKLTKTRPYQQASPTPYEFVDPADQKKKRGKP